MVYRPWSIPPQNMSKLKIGIVEDEMVIADTISLALRKLGYDACFIASNYNGAIKMIDDKKPDLVLLDIVLSGKKDGIDVGLYIREKYPMPVIFLTANSDMATVQRAKAVKPNAYLVKPFSQSDLFAAIEIAVDNHVSTENPVIESILVKDGYNFVKVFLKEIMYASSDHNYVTLYLNTDKKVMVRSTIAEMESRLSPQLFTRVNRGHIVNIDYITKVETEKIFVADIEIKITKPQRDALVALMEKRP